MEKSISPKEHLLRLPEAKRKTGKSRSAIYKEMKEGRFPQCISLGGRSVAWLESEIDAWIAERIQASRSTNKNGGR